MEKDFINNPRTEIFAEHLITCKELDTLILKGHLVTENALEYYINSEAIEKLNFNESRFTYSNKIEIAKVLGLFKKRSEKLYTQLKKLNKLRNSLAHKLDLDDKLLKSFLSSGYLTFDTTGFLEFIKTGEQIDYKIAKDEKVKIDGSHFRLLMEVSAMCSMIYKTSGLK